MTVAETAVPKAFNFKLSPSNISALHTARFRFVSMANNHSLDYGFEGLVESMHTLKEAGIAFAGVGVEEEAAAPAVVEESGVKVAFLSYSDHYDHWKATETVSSNVPMYLYYVFPGLWSVSKPAFMFTLQRLGINFIDPDSCDGDKVVQQVQRAVRAGDIPIVFIHWGPNWSWHPSE